MDIGNNIRNIRKEKKMTLKQVADIMGCSPQLISQYENGKRNPKPETIARLAEALGCDFEDICEYDKEIEQQLRKGIEDYCEHIMEDSKNSPNLPKDIIAMFGKILNLEEFTGDAMQSILSELNPDTSDKVKVLEHTRNLIGILIEILKSNDIPE